MDMQRRHRGGRTVASVVGVLLALAANPLGSQQPGGLAAARQPTPPNIVLILADDLGYGHLGAYGQRKIRTPNLDRLAAEGMRFTQAYSESICAPSRSVLMTGLHNGHARIRSNAPGMYLMPVDATVAEVLQQAGYATGGFGKWGLGDHGSTGVPWRQGFDQWFGQLHQVHAHFYYPYWVWSGDRRYPLFENRGERRERYVADVTHQHALEFIRTHHDRPFFAYLPYVLPHSELVVPEDSERPYLDAFPRVRYDDRREGYIDSEHVYATYAGMISRLDAYVGEVVELLERLEIADNTVVIFTSDNGPQGGGASNALVEFFDGNGPLRGTKGDLYEGGIRVPLIARWPGRIQAGSVSDLPVYFPDVMPTLAELAGTSPPENIDGLSFLPTLLGQSGQRRHPFMYWAFYSPQGPPRAQAVRMGDWKAVQQGDAELELYNLRTDLAESDDVAGRHPEVVRQMRAHMERALTERHHFAAVPQSGRADFVR